MVIRYGGKVYTRKPYGVRRTLRNKRAAVDRRRALDAVGMTAGELVRAMDVPGTSVVPRPSLQVATVTWTANKGWLIVNQGGICELMGTYPAGTEESKRHTNKTITYKMDCRMVVTFPENAGKWQFVLNSYWWLVYDSKPTGMMPTCSTIFDTFYVDNPSTWTVSRDVCHRFVVKNKWKITVKNNGAGVSKTTDMKSPCVPFDSQVAHNRFLKKLGCTTEWKSSSGGDIGDIKSGALYLCGAADGGKQLPAYVIGRFRLYFKSVGYQ